MDVTEFMLGYVRTLDRERAKRLLPHIRIFANAVEKFSSRDPALIAEQHHQLDLCISSAAAIGVLEDANDDLENYCEQIYSMDRGKWPALAMALVENKLQPGQWKDWQEADSPIAWLKKRANDIHEIDHEQGGSIRQSDALHEAIPLGEKIDVAEPETEAAELPRWTGRVAELRAAVQNDPDLGEFLKLRFQGYKPRAAWEHLGWQKERGQAVDKRFRRLRAKLKATGFEHQSRDVDEPGNLSDASSTVIKERHRFPVHPASESTLSGRVTFTPRPFPQPEP